MSKSGSTTTNVVGYFNPNPWPVHVSSSELGFSITLRNKGDYILINDAKVNDPILDSFVGPGRLARETSRSRVPIIYMPRASANDLGSQSPVYEADKFVQGVDGQTHAVLKPIARILPNQDAPVSLPDPGTGSSVVGMTVEMAKKLGLIKPTRTPKDEDAPNETDGAPLRGESIPEIDYAEDMLPGEARRMSAQIASKEAFKQAASEAPRRPVQPSAPPPVPPATVVSEARMLNALGIPPAVSAPSAPPVAMSDKPVESEDSQTPQAIAQSQPVEESITETAAEPAERAPTVPPSVRSGSLPIKFKCPLCTAGFPFRSGIDRHVRYKHPEQYDEVMASFGQ